MPPFLLPLQSDGSESEMGLALNRYIGNSILPALIKHSNFYSEADQHAPLLDATLHTVYRLSKCKVSLFLYIAVAHCILQLWNVVYLALDVHFNQISWNVNDWNEKSFLHCSHMTVVPFDRSWQRGSVRVCQTSWLHWPERCSLPLSCHSSASWP